MRREQQRWRTFGRWAPAMLLVGAVVLLYGSGLAERISIDNVQADQARLRGEVAAAPILAMAAFVTLDAVATAAFIPVGLVLMLAGGFLFGPLVGTAATVVGSTLGAAIGYLAARFAAGERVRRWLGRGRWRGLTEGFERAPFRYLLILRLAPLSPFGLVNVAAGCARAPFGAYVAATVLGAIPHSLIYSYLGAALGQALARDRSPDPMAVLLRPEVGLPLLALAGLGLIALAFRRRGAGGGSRGTKPAVGPPRPKAPTERSGSSPRDRSG